MLALSFHDADLFNEADRQNQPIDPPPVGYRRDESWLNDLTTEEWDDVHTAHDLRAEVEFWRLHG